MTVAAEGKRKTQREYYVQNRERIIAYNRAYRQRCKEEIARRDKARYKQAKLPGIQFRLRIGKRMREQEGCCVCGKKAGRLVWHHSDPQTKVTEATKLLAAGQWEAFFLELEKCVVACPRCHRKLHEEANSD